MEEVTCRKSLSYLQLQVICSIVEYLGEFCLFHSFSDYQLLYNNILFHAQQEDKVRLYLDKTGRISQSEEYHFSLSDRFAVISYLNQPCLSILDVLPSHSFNSMDRIWFFVSFDSISMFYCFSKLVCSDQHYPSILSPLLTGL